MKMALISIVATALCLGVFNACLADDVKVCTDRSTYPPKVVVVCNTCQCPPGYY